MTIEEIDKLREEGAEALHALDATLNAGKLPFDQVLVCLAVLRKLAR